LEQYDLSDLWYNHSHIFNTDGKGNNESKNLNDHKIYWKKFIKKRIHVHEEKKWKDNFGPKLRMYTKFKNHLILEKYLLTPPALHKGRSFHFSLRSGTNELLIEKGRWTGTKVEDRICSHCNLNKIEDEEHFLTECTKYNHLRQHLYENILLSSKGK